MEPVIFERLIEMCRHVDSFLAGGRIEHEQRFLRLDQVAQAHQFLHQRLVNLQPPGGIEDERVPVVGAGDVQRLAGNLQHVRLAFGREHRQIQLLAQGFELIHCRRAIHVGRYQQRGASLLMEQPPQLAARSRLTGAVEPHHQHAGGIAAQLQAGVLGAEQVHQLVVDDLDDLLARLNALDDLLAEGLGLDALNEVPRHLEIHVGFEQGQAHLPEGLAGIGFGDRAQAAQVPESVLELAA